MIRHWPLSDVIRRWPVNVRAVAATFAACTAWDGMGYTFGPEKWSSSPSLAAFAYWPGGIRSYGVILLCVATLLTAGTVLKDLRLVRLGLAGSLAIYLCLAFTVMGSWATEGIAAWGGPSKGLALAALAALILRRAPEGGGERE